MQRTPPPLCTGVRLRARGHQRCAGGRWVRVEQGRAARDSRGGLADAANQRLPRGELRCRRSSSPCLCFSSLALLYPLQSLPPHFDVYSAAATEEQRLNTARAQKTSAKNHVEQQDTQGLNSKRHETSPTLLVNKVLMYPAELKLPPLLVFPCSQAKSIQVRPRYALQQRGGQAAGSPTAASGGKEKGKGKGRAAGRAASQQQQYQDPFPGTAPSYASHMRMEIVRELKVCGPRI